MTISPPQAAASGDVVFGSTRALLIRETITLSFDIVDFVDVVGYDDQISDGEGMLNTRTRAEIAVGTSQGEFRFPLNARIRSRRPIGAGLDGESPFPFTERGLPEEARAERVADGLVGLFGMNGSV